jgi:hypothetical protein
MRIPRALFGWILGVLHFAFCVLFFTFYFISTDPEKSIAFSLFVPFDPWIVPLSRLPVGEVEFAVCVTVLGTFQWWAVGWLVNRTLAWLFKARSSQ